MADITLNVAKGKAAYWATLPAASDSIIVVCLENTDLVADSVMVDYDTLAAVLAGATNEQTDMGRKTLAGVTVTVNDTDDRVEITATSPQWTTTTGSAVGALLFCYMPDAGSADADIVPLSKQDWSYTPDGNTVTATIGANGFYWTT